MPPASVRMKMGKLPPDLWRETWDPDKHNLRRDRCTATLIKQKFLVCEAVGHLPKLTRATTLPTKKTSIATLPSLVGRKLSVYSRKQSIVQNEKAEVPTDYKVTDSISPEDKAKGTFDFPEGLLPLKCACGHASSLEVIRVAENHLRRKPKRRDWKVTGVLPGIGDNEKASQHPSGTQEPSSESPLASNSSASTSHIFSKCQKHPLPQESPQARHFVLIEKEYRCNCEKAFRPSHKLAVRPRPGYTLATQEEKDRAHEKFVRHQQHAAVGGATAGAMAAASGGACDGGGGGC